ncbi:MAG TPA: YbdD/YjiX family protein [Methylophilaceae bacterium]|nr:YbdD/YjiX family protein [Methylophilaceae bacterium]
MNLLPKLWRAIRRLSGDDAYERYLAHHAAHHPDQPPLSREEFFRQWQEGKWKGVKRCC